MNTHVLWVLVHCLAVLVFVNRYIAGVVLRVIRGKNWDEARPVGDGWEPTVTCVIPMYNEGAAIKETLQSLLDSDYPHHKLNVVCVDDCSGDDSYEQAREVARSSNGRLRIIRNRVNLGKRRSINRAVREADSEIIVSVDSDVVVDPEAVRALIRRFTSDNIAAVGGWVDVRNKHENWLTRMQTVKYWYSYFFMKNLEWGFRRVMCLSGCLTAYRRSVLVRRFTSDRIAAVGGWVDIRNKHENWLTRMQVVKYWYAYYFMKNLEWGFRRIMCLSGCLTAYRRAVLVDLEAVLEQRSILGCPIKYGEDRFLTRQIVKAGYLTTMTLDARCRTFVPTTVMGYFSQQLRWRRSNIVDYAGGFSHVWRLNPVLAIHFFSLFALLIVYPIALVRALEAHRFWPSLVLHLEIVVAFGVYYRWRVRKLPKSERVGALSFLSLTLLMPITYALLTPLALFTLDSGSWETRGHEPVAVAAEPIAVGNGTGQHALLPATVAAEPRTRAATGQVQLPAA
ncbi:MAG: glycosyltransferase [Acidobacteriota bacterium]